MQPCIFPACTGGDTSLDAFRQCRRCSVRPPVVLPPSLYEDAKRQGFDMSGYVKSEPLPLEGV